MDDRTKTTRIDCVQGNNAGKTVDIFKQGSSTLACDLLFRLVERDKSVELDRSSNPIANVVRPCWEKCRDDKACRAFEIDEQGGCKLMDAFKPTQRNMHLFVTCQKPLP